MKTENIQADFCVVGGGIGGITAAITAARLGARTVLIQDRPVLGGNASSEIRVWIQGATSSGRNYYSREGGVLGEIYLENMFRNPESNPHLLDALLLEWVIREPNLTLLLDTAVHECEMHPALDEEVPGDDCRIARVAGFCALNQTRYEVEAKHFADCSGDGILGFLAGADFHMGRESRDEYGESGAPEQADAQTLGDSMYFYTKRHNHPVKFIPPAFTTDITKINMSENRYRRLHKMPEPYGCELWWIEFGGKLNTVYDADKIKFHLTQLLYGVWDYIKNSGKIPDVENLSLEWVGTYPGKRESRRFLGPHVLKQDEVLKQFPFPDAIGGAGWSIDLHPSDGIYSQDAPSSHWHPDWVYNVPFASLYSRNVHNLLLAGRLMSASHVAFGSIRVMGTGGMMGQAIATAVDQCLADGVLPRDISADPARVTRLQQRLLRDGQHIPGFHNEDPDDLARSAGVTASDTYVFQDRTKPQAQRTGRDLRIMVPIADPQTEWVELLLAADADTDVELDIRLNDKAVNYHPNVEAGRVTLHVAAGEPAWHRIDLPKLDRPQNVWLTFKPNEQVRVQCTRTRVAGLVIDDHTQHYRSRSRQDFGPCLRLARPQRLFEPTNIIDGYHRPEMFPRCWTSGPLADGPQWIELELNAASAIGEVQVTLSADYSQHINTAVVESDRPDVPELLRDFDVELRDENGNVVSTIEIRDNHQAVVRVDGQGVQARRVRIVCRRAWDHDRAEVQEVRVYAPGT